jgi:hypothetical protein
VGTATSIAAVAMLVTVAPKQAQGGISPTAPGASAWAVAQAAAQAAAARAAAEASAEKAAYYSTRYPGEVGPFETFTEVLHAGVNDLYYYNYMTRYTMEWGTVFFKDRYGKWWYTAAVTDMREDSVTLDPNQLIRRPGSTVGASAHSHPQNDSQSPTDNSSPYYMFVVQPDGLIYIYQPSYDGTQNKKLKLYGRTNGYKVDTKYTKAEDVFRNDYDPYRVAEQLPGGSSDGSVWVTVGTVAAAAAVAVYTVTLLVLLLGGGGGSSLPNDPYLSDCRSTPWERGCSDIHY